MAVLFVDDTTADDGNLEETPVEQPPQEPEAPAPVPPPEPDLPPKFRGKSLTEVAKAYEELEHFVGRQGAELGELRRTQDEYIRSTLPKRNDKPVDSPTESADDDSAFFLNPREAIAKAIESNPLLKELREKTTQTQHERNAATFNAKHPDAAAIIQDQEFRAWVEKSAVRRELMTRANEKFDVDAGDEVFSTWKELRGIKAKQVEPETVDKSAAEAARKEAVRASTVPSGNAAPTDNTGGKKIFRRADLIKLQTVDPDRYAMMADEILLAYAEKRVR